MILFLVSLALAAPPTYTTIQPGEPAPFAGYILDQQALTLLAMNAKLGMECPVEIDYQVGLMEAQKEKEIRMMISDYELEVSMLQDEVDLQQDRIEKLQKLKKPVKRGAWMIVGAALGVGTTIAIANAVN